MGAPNPSPVAGAPAAPPTPGLMGPPIAAGSPGGAGGRPGVSGGGSTPEQRAKWRADSKARYQKRRQALAPLPAVGGAAAPRPPGAPPGGGGPGGAPAAPAPIPWSSDTLRPLFEQLIPAGEKLAVERLASQASKIDPALGATVAKDAAWNPAAKAGLLAAGPQCAAEVLSEMGIGADKAHWAALIISAGSIATAHVILAGKLEQLARAQRASGKASAPDTRPAPPEAATAGQETPRA